MSETHGKRKGEGAEEEGSSCRRGRSSELQLSVRVWSDLTLLMTIPMTILMTFLPTRVCSPALCSFIARFLMTILLNPLSHMQAPSHVSFVCLPCTGLMLPGRALSATACSIYIAFRPGLGMGSKVTRMYCPWSCFRIKIVSGRAPSVAVTTPRRKFLPNTSVTVVRM